MNIDIEYLAKIVRVIIEHEEFLEDDPDFNWSEFSFVIGIDKNGNVNKNYGYAYDASGNYSANAVDNDDLDPPVRELYDVLFKDRDDEDYIWMLLQFNRDNRQVEVDFDYGDKNRWKVTPNNIDQMIEELRPKFGEK